MADIEYIRLEDVAELLPFGKDMTAVSYPTLRQWVVIGRRLPGGDYHHRVFLKAIKLGGRWMTTREWVDQFSDVVTSTFIAREGHEK